MSQFTNDELVKIARNGDTELERALAVETMVERGLLPELFD